MTAVQSPSEVLNRPDTSPGLDLLVAQILRSGEFTPDTLYGESETVVLPVSGVMNAGSDWHSTAAAHFFLARRDMHRAGATVEQPMVLPGFGVVGNLEAGYRQFEDDVYSTLGRHGLNTQPILVGHSLGGLYPARFIATHGIGQAITLGTPHGKMRNIRLPQALRHFEPYSHRCDEIAEFSADTHELLAAYPKRAEKLVTVGSTVDQIVPLAASLPADMTNPSQVVLTQLGMKPKRLHAAEKITVPGVEHITMITRKKVRQYLGRKVAEFSAANSSPHLV